MSRPEITVTEIIQAIMPILECYGYDIHTLWGTMNGEFLSIAKFYRDNHVLQLDQRDQKQTTLIVRHLLKKVSMTVDHVIDLTKQRPTIEGEKQADMKMTIRKAGLAPAYLYRYRHWVRLNQTILMSGLQRTGNRDPVNGAKQFNQSLFIEEQVSII